MASDQNICEVNLIIMAMRNGQLDNNNSRKLPSHQSQMSLSHMYMVVLSEKNEVPFSMAIGNVELIEECFPKHFCKNEIRPTKK